MEVVSLVFLGVLMVISPGADFVLVVRNSLAQGRKCGVWTGLGIGSAISIHVIYSLLGLGYLISQYTVMFDLLRYLGAGYLFYLGVSSFRSGMQGQTQAVQVERLDQVEILDKEASIHSALNAYQQGFLCNMLNPKTMLFFISIFSQIVVSEQALLQGVLYGVYLAILHAAWFASLACLLTIPAFLQRFSLLKPTIEKCCGVGLIGFGAAVVVNT
ncbi:LysE family translocator [Thaumasiovibrio subtropicus]|uniref:LysE family translocator n=1 Tax=Thaumasiovibrio subtropicus TaxID=1891207 RepID=UPI000B363284|nr:LysE family transporter [Thaumasiovibrio subtropicus]